MPPGNENGQRPKGQDYDARFRDHSPFREEGAFVLEEFFQPLRQDGMPAAIELTPDGESYLSSNEFKDESERTRRNQLAKRSIPPIEHHAKQLESEQRVIERDLERFSERGRRVVLRKDTLRTAVAVPLILGIVGLAMTLCYVGYIDINTAIAGIRQGDLYETPNPNPMLPAIEPSDEVCLGLALIPIAGLFTALEFVHFAFRKKKPGLYLFGLAGVGLPLAIGCTFLFAHIFFGGGVNRLSVIGPEFQSDAPPWYYFALSTTGMGVFCAMLMSGISYLASWFFEYAPKEERFHPELERARNHITECIVKTQKTLAHLYAVGANNERTQKIRELQNEISKLG